ncbi:DUF4125 family protein [Desulfatibacillum aliphaticivorans]|uniref:DUF4125 family protein n=1 Tax=Desulfatibacillum aliphaticivorans TaxID=218208 RepID=UPI00042731C0|nr:DUF4125 family protein [Desulfatibacillum aliphaticivorans]
MQSNESIINDIIALELEMFLAVNAKEPAACQDNPERFKDMRKAQFWPWSKETLESYLQDLKDAVRAGKNLFTLKYARMDNLIPRLNLNPAVSGIAEAQLLWQRMLAEEYPKTVGRGRSLEDGDEKLGGGSFLVYATSELETYSDRTLDLLGQDVLRHFEAKTNMSRIVYEKMVSDLGYASLDEAEALAR